MNAEFVSKLLDAKRLEAEGFRVPRLAPNRQGFVEPAALEAVLDEDAVLVSVQAANSEVGSIQPIAALASAAHGAGALFHTDAVQALGKAPVDVGAWGVDAASFSAHKVGGPKGVGALYLRARTPFEPQAIGGGTYAKAAENCAAFGPAFPGEDTHIHDCDEFMDLESLERATAIYYRAIELLMAD